MNWPEGKKFAFTIIDDTDNSFVDNIKPIYDLLSQLNLRTTKTVWVYPPRDHFEGYSLQTKIYLDFVKDLQAKKFQIELHNVGSGNFTRSEIFSGFEEFKNHLGNYPTMHINHSRNADNIYWGYKRFVFPLSLLFRLLPSRRAFSGEDPKSPNFWGDLAKEKIKYCRNLVFNGINTHKYDPKMPYLDSNKEKYSNYWFSSSDAHTVEEFCSLLNKENVDELERDGGFCIAYTHFASNFVDKEGNVSKDFKDKISYLASKNGWFVPANELLDYLLSQQQHKKPKYSYFLSLNLRWISNRIQKKIKYKR